jgi:DNA-binding transcriptional LysR family regulator
MTLEQLRIFLAVAERQHVTRAAQALGLTQSAVSAAVAALEGAHGVALFDRIGRGITLTEAGTAFVPAARAVLAQAETARLVLEDLAQEPRGRLRLHASQTVASYWLPPQLVRFHAAFPKVEITLSVGNTAQVAQAVQAGEADLGFVEGAVAQGDLHRQVVARDQLVLIMAQGHPWAGRSTIAPADYPRLRWILREAGSGTRSEFEAHLAAQGLMPDDLQVALEMPSNAAVLTAVAAGDCVSALSARAVATAPGGLIARPIAGAERPFAVLSHPARHRTRAARALLAQITGGGGMGQE